MRNYVSIVDNAAIPSRSLHSENGLNLNYGIYIHYQLDALIIYS